MWPQRLGNLVSLPEGSVWCSWIVGNIVVNNDRKGYSHVEELDRVDACSVDCLGIEHAIDLRLECRKTSHHGRKTIIQTVTKNRVCNVHACLGVAFEQSVARSRRELASKAFVSLCCIKIVVISNRWSVVWIAPRNSSCDYIRNINLAWRTLSVEDITRRKCVLLC